VKLSELQYDLPPERIAQQPCQPRDAARLLVLDRRTGRIAHRVIRRLPEYLRDGDCLVINATRVLPAKFVARRATGGKIADCSSARTAPGRWNVLPAASLGSRKANGLRARCAMTLRCAALEQRGACEVTIDPPTHHQTC
jgi:S-adenosylmethionine:tRNA-ribosyltransferase-isomerase (queuine synthetase)